MKSPFACAKRLSLSCDHGRINRIDPYLFQGQNESLTPYSRTFLIPSQN